MELATDGVHVWRASVHALAQGYGARLSVLSNDERARADRFFFERDRRCFVVGRSLLRTLLARYLDLDPRELRFRYGAQGKPELAFEARDLQFNLSHAGDRILIALARGRWVGVDVELIRALPDLENVTRRFFSVYERAELDRLPDSERQAAFFAIWTRKEAFIKAIGEGLSHPLDAFDVTVAPGVPARLVASRPDPNAPASWRLVDLGAGPGYAAALAAEGHAWALKCLNVHADAFAEASEPDLIHS